MNNLISFLIVTASVFGGYQMAHGPFHVLYQPAEYVVIFGTLLGALIGYAPLGVFKSIVVRILTVHKGSGVDKTMYTQLLGLLFVIFNIIRKEGVLGIESDLTNPHESERFKRFPAVLKNHHALDLLVGSLRLFVDGVVNAFDLDKLMETEIETHHHEAGRVPTLLAKTADAAPGIGIVAAVLGIIITMQHIDGPPSEIGAHVGAALVGTFLGILLGYGYLQPIVGSMESTNHETHVLMNTIRAGVVSFAGGAPPAVALEFARKSIESANRPSDQEMEQLQNELRRV